VRKILHVFIRCSVVQQSFTPLEARLASDGLCSGGTAEGGAVPFWIEPFTLQYAVTLKTGTLKPAGTIADLEPRESD
jgi:hypothetical protein